MTENIENNQFPIPVENREEVPFADCNCKICCLPLDLLKQLHALKFFQNWKLSQLSNWLQTNCGITYEPSRISIHFTKHVKTGYLELVQAQALNQILPVEEAKDLVKSNPYVESATATLAKLTALVSEKVYDNFQHLDISSEKFKADVSEKNALDAYVSIAKMLKEVRELVRDVSLIRSPQVIMEKYLEDALKHVISECCLIFTKIVLDLNKEIVEEVKNKKTVITETSFAMLYSRNAINLKSKLDTKAREIMNKFKEELATLAKII